LKDAVGKAEYLLPKNTALEVLISSRQATTLNKNSYTKPNPGGDYSFRKPLH
jgi:hypothetical protein